MILLKSLEAAGLQDGDQLTAVVGEIKLASTATAFALWCCGGDGVVTWGNPGGAGDSSAVQEQLSHRTGIFCYPGRWISRDMG